MLNDGGEDSVQMKELSQRAGVALATLYRYFPSKQHLILAVLANRYEEAQDRLRREAPSAGTVRERVADYLIRAFRSQMRVPEFTAAVQRALFQTGPEHAELVDRIMAAYMENVLIAAGPMNEAQLQVLPVVLGVAQSTTSHWLAGHLSPADVRFHILVASRLLDLPPDAPTADQRAARTETSGVRRGSAEATTPRTAS
jgi:TetR/AcrR family transcriptional regulator, cholesterol catabolism regulator